MWKELNIVTEIKVKRLRGLVRERMKTEYHMNIFCKAQGSEEEKEDPESYELRI